MAGVSDVSRDMSTGRLNADTIGYISRLQPLFTSKGSLVVSWTWIAVVKLTFCACSTFIRRNGMMLSTVFIGAFGFEMYVLLPLI